MKLKVLTVLAAVIFAASSAQGTMVAGWDFSYLDPGAAGFPFIPAGGVVPAPGDFSGAYPANWSDLDAAGAPQLGVNNSQAFGTVFWNGTNGSTNEIPTGAGDILFTSTPSTSLLSNRLRPAGGDMDASSSLSLPADGAGIQNQWSDLALNPRDVLSIVFQADVTSTGLVGEDWLLSFAARTEFTGQDSTLQIDVSLDGVAYTMPALNVGINDTDTLYEVALPALTNGQGVVFARITTGDERIFLDNVAIDATLVPEPGTALLMLAGLSGLAAAGRRKAVVAA